MILKYLIYMLHIAYILFSTVGLIFYWQSLITLFITIISWYLNNNECLFTHFEYYFFKESLIDYYYKYILKDKNRISKFKVPYIQRFIIKIIFILGLSYYLF